MTRNKHLLIADDDPSCLFTLNQVLSHAGYSVTQATDGEAAWELFRRPPGSFLFDLVVTDIAMPRLDGLALAERIRRADPHIPVLVLSVMDNASTIKAALRAGIREYLEKPLSPASLCECVDRLLSDRASVLLRREQQTAEAVRKAQRSFMGRTDGESPLHFCFEPFTDAGGDVFRHFKRPDGSYVFVLADVAGHSVESSYAVASFLGALSLYSLRDTPLVDLARHLNRSVYQGPFAEYPVCTLLGTWHPRTGRLHLLNAGIPHALIFHRHSGSISPVPLDGTPLGYFEEPILSERVIMLQPGDRAFLGTDGFFDVLDSSIPRCAGCAENHFAQLRDDSIETALRKACDRVRNCVQEELRDDYVIVGFEQGNKVCESGEWLTELPITPTTVDDACAAFDTFLVNGETTRELDSTQRFGIVLAVREALNNATTHGRPNADEGEVSLHAHWRDFRTLVVRVCITLRDAGQTPFFDLNHYLTPEEPLREHGRGIPIMRLYATSIAMLDGETEMVFSTEGMHV